MASKFQFDKYTIPERIGSSVTRLFVPLAFFGCSSMFALEIKFNVIYESDTIGDLRVSKTLSEGEIKFTYRLDLTSTFLFKKIRVQYDMEATYAKTELRYYHLVYKINGGVNDDVVMNWETDHYTIKSLKKKDTDRHDFTINYTTVLLFFGEPTRRTRVWGELNCRYQALSRTADLGYAMDTGGGRNNTFYYKAGILVKAFFDTPVLDFEILRE